MRRRSGMFAAAFAVMTIWIGGDLASSRVHSLRSFEPDQVALRETEMWRAYYEHRPVRLFIHLARLLREQYGLPFWQSNVGAYHAASAAVTFQRGQSRADYEKALPDVRRFYALIRKHSDTAFDVDRVASIEVEWWIAHRERRPDLAEQLALLQSAMYAIPAERLGVHADLRARAMLYRDRRGADITDLDWQKIRIWLEGSWRSLHGEVRSLAVAAR